MTAFGGVGRGGANMEEAGYCLYVLQGHSLSCPHNWTCVLPGHNKTNSLLWHAFPSAMMVSTTFEPNQESRGYVDWALWNNESQLMLSFALLGDLCLSLPHWWEKSLVISHLRGERTSRSLETSYRQVGTLKHTSSARRRHPPLPCFYTGVPALELTEAIVLQLRYNGQIGKLTFFTEMI